MQGSNLHPTHQLMQDCFHFCDCEFLRHILQLNQNRNSWGRYLKQKFEIMLNVLHHNVEIRRTWSDHNFLWLAGE